MRGAGRKRQTAFLKTVSHSPKRVMLFPRQPTSTTKAFQAMLKTKDDFWWNNSLLATARGLDEEAMRWEDQRFHRKTLEFHITWLQPVVALTTMRRVREQWGVLLIHNNSAGFTLVCFRSICRFTHLSVKFLLFLIQTALVTVSSISWVWKPAASFPVIAASRTWRCAECPHALGLSKSCAKPETQWGKLFPFFFFKSTHSSSAVNPPPRHNSPSSCWLLEGAMWWHGAHLSNMLEWKRSSSLITSVAGIAEKSSGWALESMWRLPANMLHPAFSPGQSERPMTKQRRTAYVSEMYGRKRLHASSLGVGHTAVEQRLKTPRPQKTPCNICKKVACEIPITYKRKRKTSNQSPHLSRAGRWI